MSSDSQENSPERQMVQIEAYCRRRGYDIVRRYQDLGLKGYDDTRPAFQQLIADAQLGIFSHVVVDEQSRLSRNSPLDYFALVAHPLERAGVILDTVAKGIRSWTDLGDIITQTVDQHTASGEVITISRRVVTELARNALSGDVVAGKPPYGYDLVWTDECGVEHPNLGGSERRPSGWRPTWRINQDQAKVVRWVFDAYLGDLTLTGIIQELYRRGVPSPRGNPHWHRSHVRNLLRNSAYVGDWTYNRTTTSSFHRLSFEGEGAKRSGMAEPKKANRPAGRKTPVAGRNPKQDWVVITDHHHPLVDRETFARTGAALVANAGRCAPTAHRDEYALSRLLVCARCNNWMAGAHDVTGKFYRCGGYTKWGLDVCQPYRIREDDALALVDQELSAHFLSPERLTLLRAEARRRQDESTGQSAAAELRKSAAALQKKIDRAKGNLLLLDPDFVPAAQAQLREWEKERLRMEADSVRLEGEKPAEDVERLIAFIEQRLWNLREAMSAGSPKAVGKAVRAVLCKMELMFESRKLKVKTRHTLVGGVSHFIGGEQWVFDLSWMGEIKGELSTTEGRSPARAGRAAS